MLWGCHVLVTPRKCIILSITLTFVVHKLPYKYVCIQLSIHNQETAPVMKDIIAVKLEGGDRQ